MVTVHRLPMASVKPSGKFNPPTYHDVRINVYAYAVTLPDSSVILVDTGVGSGNEQIEHRFEPERMDVDDALRHIGKQRSDVRTIVNSHLHFDHCGNNACFPQAVVFVRTQELQVARDLRARYTVPEWFDYPGAFIQEVRGDVEIAPGVMLISTPGHTPGHQSVLIATADEQILVAAQAAFTADEFLHGGNPLEQAHEGLSTEYVDSIRKLKSLGADRVLFSHDHRAVNAELQLEEP